jgi:hypothetical protein
VGALHVVFTNQEKKNSDFISSLRIHFFEFLTQLAFFGHTDFFVFAADKIGMMVNFWSSNPGFFSDFTRKSNSTKNSKTNGERAVSGGRDYGRKNSWTRYQKIFPKN